MQPLRQRLAFADRAKAACKDKEGCLEGVLGVLLVPQDAAAYAHHHRTVARYQFGEGRSVSPGGKVLEQLTVGKARLAVAPRQFLDATNERAKL
jgi:hypothetical protein